MSRASAEHRRGLVLGLTLAEVMLLVLFLLLLGFGALFAKQGKQIADLQGRLNESEAEKETWTRLQPLVEEWNKKDPSAAADIEKLISRLVRVGELEKRVQELTGINAKLEDQLTQLRREIEDSNKGRKPISDLLLGAAKINPGDPVSVLRRGLEGEEKGLRKERDGLRAERDKAQKELDAARKRIGELESIVGKGGKGHTWPPLIVLGEAEGYYFESGKAELTEPFKQKLKESIIPLLLSRMKEYQVNVIEVVGHTDPMPIRGRPSNLDDELLSFFNDERTDIALEASDNTGLGMARAAAVVQFLRTDERLKAYRGQILPLSSGQVLELSGLLSNDKNYRPIRERRRIEIRLRRPGTNQ